MNAEEFPYLGALIRESGEDDALLQEILQLADEGLGEHVETIVQACSREANADAVALVTATHRLTNVTAALRLETIARELNQLEALARQERLGEFCGMWMQLGEKIAALHDEVQRAQRG